MTSEFLNRAYFSRDSINQKILEEMKSYETTASVLLRDSPLARDANLYVNCEQSVIFSYKPVKFSQHEKISRRD